MQTYIIDIQNLYDKRHALFPKEITIMSIEKNFFTHWVIKSPHNLLELPKGIMKFNREFTRAIHGIEWSDGECSLERVEFFLHRLASTAIKVYTEGRSSVRYLEKFMSCPIIDSHEVAPPISDLPSIEDRCIFHGVKKEQKYICSYNRAHKLKRYIKTKNDDYVEMRPSRETLIV